MFSKNGFPILILTSSSFLWTSKLSKRTKMSDEKKNFRILVAGGSLFAKETGIHSTCELLTVSKNGRVDSKLFATLNEPRRGANCFLLRDRIWIVGGCKESANSQVEHLKSGEYFDLNDSYKSSSMVEKTGIGNWYLSPRLLNIGRSCFSTAAFATCDISENRTTKSDDFLLVFGGWNGIECLSNVECIQFKASSSSMNNDSSPGTQIDAATTTTSTGGVAASSIITTTNTCSSTTTSTISSAASSAECVSTGDLISSIKNGCTVVVVDDDVSSSDEQRNRVLYLVGGWDGKRTLNTIFRYTFSSSSIGQKSLCEESTMQIDRLLPYGVECHATVLNTNDRTIFIIGGFDGLRVLDSIIRIDLKNNEINILPTKLAVPRECHCAELLISDDLNLLVVLGGWDGYKSLRSVEIFRIINESPYLVPISFIDDALLYARNRACSLVLPF